jgi:hypothetical protein
MLSKSETNIPISTQSQMSRAERRKQKGNAHKLLSAKFNAFQQFMLKDEEKEWNIFKLSNKNFFETNKKLSENTLKELVSKKIFRPKDFLFLIIGKI